MTRYVKDLVKVGDEFEMETAEGLRFRLRRDEIPTSQLDEIDGIADDIAKAKTISTGSYNKFTSKLDAEAWADNAFSSWENSLTASESSAITAYTGDGCYQNINNVLRGFESQFEGNNAQIVEDISQAISKTSLPENVTLYRGTSKAMLGESQNIPPEQLVGEVIGDKAFMSTSLVPEGAFNGDLTLIIEAPAGSNGAFVGNLSQYPGEVEVLLNKGQQMLVKQVIDAGTSNMKLVVELIP